MSTQDTTEDRYADIRNRLIPLLQADGFLAIPSAVYVHHAAQQLRKYIDEDPECYILPVKEGGFIHLALFKTSYHSNGQEVTGMGAAVAFTSDDVLYGLRQWYSEISMLDGESLYHRLRMHVFVDEFRHVRFHMLSNVPGFIGPRFKQGKSKASMRALLQFLRNKIFGMFA